MKFSSDHSYFAYVLKTNLDYYLSTYISKLVVLTTSQGEIVIEPSKFEFLHLVGGHYYPQNRWGQSALKFFHAVEEIDHKEEKTYDEIGLKNVMAEINESSSTQEIRYGYDRTIYFQPVLRSFMQCEPKHLFIYYRNQSHSNLRADYLYLHNEEEENNLPVYLGLLGKRERPYFIMHTIRVDRERSIQHRNFSKVKVSRLRFLPNNQKTRDRLEQENLVVSHAYQRTQTHTAQKNSSRPKKTKDLPKMSSDIFLKHLNQVLKTIDSKYSAATGSQGKASFCLKVNNKKTSVEIRPSKTLKAEDIAHYLVETYKNTE